MRCLAKLLLPALLLCCITVSAQVGINILIPDSTAILHLESTDKGFLPPRLTTVQRDAIVRPATGLTIFNLNDSVIQVYNGRCWLATYQRNCDECDFIISVSSANGNIDRTLHDSAFTDISVRQIGGTPQHINLITIAGLPSGMTAVLDSSVVDSAGTVRLRVYASVFAPAGTYPIIVQGVCGSNIRLVVYTVVVEPCITVNLTSSATNYDLQAANGLAGPGTPICVVFNVAPGVSINSANASQPAYSSGNLDNRSNVGILNNGNIIGRGGDGAYGGGLTGIPPGNPGNPGGDAMNLSCRTTIVNNGYIYGGGSGGGSVGLSFSFTIPFVGSSVTIGAGLGGGGGAELGAGGAAPSGIVIGAFRDGSSATAGVGAAPGAGGSFSAPISIPVGPASITVTPSGGGGNGGAFGQTGAAGYLDLSIAVGVTIPFIGTISIPIPIPGGLLPLRGPASGSAGAAVKRNSHALFGLSDGAYSTLFIKGNVTP